MRDDPTSERRNKITTENIEEKKNRGLSPKFKQGKMTCINCIFTVYLTLL